MQNLEPLSICVQAKIPVYLEGAPGIGKSATVQSIGKSLNYLVIVVTTADRDPSDFGFPIVDGMIIRRGTQSWVRQANDAIKDGYAGCIIFLDEVSNATHAVQGVLMRITHERFVGDDKLADHVSLVLAGNTAETSAAAQDLIGPLSNRVVILPWSADVSTWIDGTLAGWPTPSIKRVPEDYHQALNNQLNMVTTYIRTNPHKFMVFPTNEADVGKPWPSPRSWTLVARLMALCEATHASRDSEAALMFGTIGQGFGLEFLEWRDSLDLPDPAEVLAKPHSFILPERGDVAYAALTSIAQYARDNFDGDSPKARQIYVAAWTVFNTVANVGHKDMAAAAVRLIAKFGKHHLKHPDTLKVVTPMLKPFVELLTAKGYLD